MQREEEINASMRQRMKESSLTEGLDWKEKTKVNMWSKNVRIS